MPKSKSNALLRWQLVYKFHENSRSKITVPTSIDNCHHPSCYKIFTSVSSKEVLSALQRKNVLDQAANQNSSQAGTVVSGFFNVAFL